MKDGRGSGADEKRGNDERNYKEKERKEIQA